jgi:thiopurine S-methyltransferase
MDAQFWINAWNEGRTAFHQQDYHPKLVQYFPALKPEAGQRVLVPLCGKTKDMLWLRSLGLRVQGVELHEKAVEAFFTENGLSPAETTRDRGFIRYRHGDIAVNCGDFFQLGESEAYDLVYDRAALVALPAAMRKQYAEVVKRALKKGGNYLLISYEYDQSKMDGPPFSVSGEEIRALFGDECSIELKESGQPPNEGARLAALGGLRQNVYALEKRLG